MMLQAAPCMLPQQALAGGSVGRDPQRSRSGPLPVTPRHRGTGSSSAPVPCRRLQACNRTAPGHAPGRGQHHAPPPPQAPLPQSPRRSPRTGGACSPPPQHGQPRAPAKDQSGGRLTPQDAQHGSILRRKRRAAAAPAGPAPASPWPAPRAAGCGGPLPPPPPPPHSRPQDCERGLPWVQAWQTLPAWWST